MRGSTFARGCPTRTAILLHHTPKGRRQGMNSNQAQNSAAVTQPSFPRAWRRIHWISALLILVSILCAWTIDLLPRGARGGYLVIHTSTGFLIAGLLLARLYFRLRYGPPPRVSGPLWERQLARFVYVPMLLLLAIQPLTGWALASARGTSSGIFFGLSLPELVSRNRSLGRTLAEVHEVGANLLLLLIAAHILAVAWHHFVRRDGLLKRMTG